MISILSFRLLLLKIIKYKNTEEIKHTKSFNGCTNIHSNPTHL